MGYQSQVQSLIYGPADQVWALYTAEKLRGNEALVGWFAGCIKHWVNPGDSGFIQLNITHVKWYSEYPEVEAWEVLLEEAAKRGLCTEFVRVGEGADNDIESRYTGDDVEYLLQVSRVIVCNLEVPDN